MKYISIVFALFLAFSGIENSLLGQRSQNLDQLSNWDKPNLPSYGGLVYNEIWGWADSASGREYAIIGTLAETYFIEVTNPFNPVVRDSVAGGHSNCIHRDFKTYRNYCYGVADEGQNSTLQIFDLSYLPDSVHVVYDSSEFFVRAHNIFINEKSGRLYGVGTDTLNGGLVILDIATNPEAPTSLGYFNLGAYTHDLYVRNDTVFNNNGWSGMAIWDMTNLSNPNPLGSFSGYPQAGYNHSNWVTENGKHMVMCDETHNRPVRVVDVSDLNNLSIVSSFQSQLNAPQDTKSIAHNPLIHGDFACVSYYHDGVQIYDISDPTSPMRAAYFDTDTTDSVYVGYDGCWGVYPFLPSGNIIASDVVFGLYVLRPGFVFPNAVQPTVATTGVCTGVPGSGTATALPAGGIAPYSYQWSTGDTTVSISGLSLNTTYTVTVTDRYGYSGVDTFNLQPNAPWNVQDTVTDESCSNLGDGIIALNIAGGTSPYSVLWSTGDAIPTVTGLTNGTYSVVVTDSAGCSYTDSFTVGFLNQTPVAVAGVDTSLCLRNTILTGSAPAIGQGAWQVLVGSGTFNNLADPQSVVLGLGEGLNTLVWVTSNGVCTDADTVNIYVSSAAYAGAGVDTLACGNNHVLAGHAPMGGQGQWSGPTGVQFTNMNDPQSMVSGLSSGLVTLTWMVSDSGCTASDNVILTVAPFAESNFGFSVSNLLVTFTDSSANADTWFWDFGDSTGSTLQNPVHSYSTPGSYQACLIVSDTCGLDTFCQTVNIQCVPPSAGFSLADTLLSIDLSNTSTTTFPNAVYSWDFGDSTTSSSPSPSHTYSSPGTYQVCLTLTDSCGSETNCQTVVIECPGPVADFLPTPSFNTVTFSNQSTTADPSATYSWNFGDGTTSTMPNPVHTYQFAGTYQTCLTVSDVCGSDTSCQEFEVEIAVGLQDELIGNVRVSPNPFSDLLKLEISGWSAESVILGLWDVQGRKIKNADLRLESGVGEMVWDLESLPGGVYLLSVKGKEVVKHYRIVRQ